MKALRLTATALIVLSVAGLTSCVSMNSECCTECATKAKPGTTTKASGASKTGSSQAGGSAASAAETHKH